MNALDRLALTSRSGCPVRTVRTAAAAGLLPSVSDAALPAGFLRRVMRNRGRAALVVMVLLVACRSGGSRLRLWIDALPAGAPASSGNQFC